MGKFSCQIRCSPSGRFGLNAKKLSKQPNLNEPGDYDNETGQCQPST